MKLFKSLLIAPATLGLLAPMSATANELNLAEVSGYSSSEEVQNISEFYPKELAVTNSRVDGLEARMNNIEAGSFSETTTASFSADFMLGAVDDTPTADTGDTGEGSQSLMGAYSFQIDLNTSFTGEDSLDISLDAGNAGSAGVAEFDGNATSSDSLVVDGVSYTFPVGGATVMVGDNTDGSALFTTACVYGGPSNTLDDCGNVNAGITNGGAMAGAAYDFGNGFTGAVGYAGPEGGIMTEESDDAYAINAAYTADNYGLSLTYGVVETGTEEDTFTAINGYYTPDGFPSISVGFESGEDGSVTTSSDSLESFFVGLTWDEIGPGSAGIAMGTKTPTVEDTDEEYMYEAYYSYPINDGMTITPLVFIKEVSTAGSDDETGIMVKTSFSF
ncbi:MAG: porin [Prochlorococcus marinus CUG1439]|uniref:porin n=1 Tax=Prochlorococcus sp. MIT 1314 TaxID=3096220 RepID=UPI001B28CDA8|nr:porin [Prochlorococcus sp. MIT 1314]MCR8540479.1 porin [Prochlorococcus marinus CUG1439]